MAKYKKPFFEVQLMTHLDELDRDIEQVYATGPADLALLGVEIVKDSHENYTCAPYSVFLLKRLFQIAGDWVPPHIARSEVRTETMNIAEIDRLADKCRAKLGLA